MLATRLALEQEDALNAAAERCGYSPDAVQRAFRARYWSEPGHGRSPAEETECSRVVLPERELVEREL